MPLQLNNIRVFILLVACMFCNFAHANNDDTYGLISLQESVETEVENDLMHATLTVQHHNRNAKKVATLINADMQWALHKVHAVKSVQAKTINYSVHPVYKDKKIKSWSGRQQMSLQSKSFEELTSLIADLQEKLQVNNITFSISPQKYKDAENALLASAVQAFTHKAEIITEAMQAKKFVVVNMKIHTNKHYAQPVKKIGTYNSMRVDAAIMAEPGLVAGSNNVLIDISGQIKIQ